ncbi:uncharacterized protein BXZ73DRAFT_76563 [Epithele typhae]|uniref:uncharacterized protein n=1 Tax=Epithele typhae TaxID=378194 RepID=UPI0020079F27|nr:uncharacterized protein BXZ73DRAFT_76563 [Epithele typhae]KAH9936736.1 hypothetical protein BXZ73DRAFT_76563 [Epithele typhae]
MKMRMGDSNRLEAFPSHFTRMRRSNVPDYTHDPMTTIIYLLRRDVPPRWPSDNCTLMLPDEVLRNTRRNRIDSFAIIDGPVPTPASPRRARDGCQHPATRVLGNAFILGRTRHSPTNVCIPPNVVAFFGLFMRLRRPPHLLALRISRAHPQRLHGTFPISDRKPRRMLTDLLLHAHRAPSRFRARADIAVREAPLEPTSAMHMFMTGHPLPWWSPQAPFQLCTLLVLCRVDAISLGSLAEADLIRRVFEDRPWAPVPGTAFVLTELEYVHRSKSVRVRMSETRVVRMREERWCTVLCRGENRSQVQRSTKQPAAHRVEPAQDGRQDALLLNRAPLAVRPAARKPSPTGAKLSSKLQAFRQTVKPAGRDTGGDAIVIGQRRARAQSPPSPSAATGVLDTWHSSYSY